MPKSSPKKKKQDQVKKLPSQLINRKGQKKSLTTLSKVFRQNFRSILIVLGLAVVLLLAVLIVSKFFMNDVGKISVLNPNNGAVFPPEITAPSFRWIDNRQGVDNWSITFEFDDEKSLIKKEVSSSIWKPENNLWETIKTRSLEKEVKITIRGFESIFGFKKRASEQTIVISTSKDSVSAPIFYRDVPLPFSFALQNLGSIRWRLGDISSEKQPKIVLENLPVCGNCHSFSKDGKYIGMDVDYANDKGSYVIAKIENQIGLSDDKIITWSDYKREDGELTFGLLSQISPDGRYAVSTVKDRSIFVPKDDLTYSQLFFPIKGILVVYDQITKKYWSLPGASDPSYVQSNPTWSPEGDYLIFARSRTYHDEKILKSKDVILNPELAKPFLNGDQGFKFDLFRIPFNDGKGGKAEPIAGASNNGMSNYFPRVSPDGKWIVFTRAKNFMLLQPDSKLYIMPSQGGFARLMNCNTAEMNSWHSWAPNGKWLVFSSKFNGSYTQLYLTHIDEKGNDTPPVLLENLTTANRAVNIPEFVNIRSNKLEKIVDEFSNDCFYLLRTALNELNMGNKEKGITLFNEALEDSLPIDTDIYTYCGHIESKLGDYRQAIKFYDKALALDSALYKVLAEKGYIKYKLKFLKEAKEDFDKAIKINPEYMTPYRYRAVIHYLNENYKNAFEDYKKFIELGGPKDNKFYNELSEKQKTN